MHVGQGPGLSQRSWGAKGGTEKETLTNTQIPAHSHGLRGTSQTATTEIATGAMLATTPQNAAGVRTYNPSNTQLITLHSDSIMSSGGNQSHNNMPPFVTVNFIISLTGIYPSRN